MTQDRTERMKGIFRGELETFRDRILVMANIAEVNLTHAIRALVEREDSLTDLVEKEDSRIDSLEIEIDELVITYMATHGSMASQGRALMTCSKISGLLEKIGDQAVTIARRARRLNAEPELKPLVTIPEMASITVDMIRSGIGALVQVDPDQCLEIVRRDKQVDALNREFEKNLTHMMLEDSASVIRALQLILISRSMERAADAAKSIAEEVHFLYTARDIRHGRIQSPSETVDSPQAC